MNNDKIFEIYTLIELTYEKQFKGKENELYPRKWYEIKDYQKKIEILSESLQNNILINDTIGYKTLIKR